MMYVVNSVNKNENVTVFFFVCVCFFVCVFFFGKRDVVNKT